LIGGARSAFFAAVSLIVLNGCGQDSRRSVLLVTLDTSRRDHYGTYGNPDARTPWLDALARSGRLYRNAFVDASTTLPSHTTMLTGELGPRHGVRLNGVFALRESARTVTEMLSERGFATGAVMSSAALAKTFGLSQGFAVYDDDMPATYTHYDPALWIRARRLAGNQRRAREATAAAARVLQSFEPPAFVWVHYIDAHQPDDPEPPWGRVPGLSPYAAEIATVDREMGRMLRAARARLGELAIVVIADHGENRGEQRELGHELFLTEAILRVPFVVHGPGVEPRLVTGTVTNADVAPTMLDLAGVSGESFPDGMSALAAEGAERPIVAETLAPTQRFGGAPVRVLRAGGWKYVWTPRPEVYDLTADPSEMRNLFGDDPARDARLFAELKSTLACIGETAEPAERARLGEKERQALEALGYVASSGGAERIEELAERGLDPKDLVDVVCALESVEDGLMDWARPRMERFWREHSAPESQAWNELFSRAHFCQGAIDYTDGRREAALANAREAIRLDPDWEDARLLFERVVR
jgi:arylsulfatase A-like enzyme